MHIHTYVNTRYKSDVLYYYMYIVDPVEESYPENNEEETDSPGVQLFVTYLHTGGVHMHIGTYFMS